MKVGISYKQHPINEQFDAIIIGSGIGGLTVAAILARFGKKPLLLERHYTAGGFTHTFKRKNYEWDVGLHYVGELDKKGRVLRQLFDFITDGKLQWADMGEVYDKLIFGETEYCLVKGLQNFEEQMKRYFPSPRDCQAIDDYLDLLSKANGASRKFFVEKALPDILSSIAGGWLRAGYMKYASASTLDTLKKITDNKKLIGVLTGQFGDYGLPPSQSSFAMHALVVKHYMNGGFYPIGGSGKIAETIWPVIESTGGKIYINAEVQEIIVRDNKAVGVKMADGNEIFAPSVISNTGVINTYSRLLPRSAGNNGVGEMLQKLEPSAAHFSLYIGLKTSAQELQLPKSNYWIYPDNYDHDENLKNFIEDQKNPLPVTYISFPAAKDPDFENRFPGRSTIEVIGLAPYEWFKKWEGTKWNKRGADYEDLKEYYTQRLLDQLYRFVPQVRGKIDHMELSTPLSTANFVNYSRGEIYGLAHSPQRFHQKLLRPKTSIEKLYLTGQDITTCGIAGGLMAGMLTATAVLKKNVWGRMMSFDADKV